MKINGKEYGKSDGKSKKEARSKAAQKMLEICIHKYRKTYLYVHK